MKILTCIIVYNREENIKRWLSCWNKSDQSDSILAIIHNQDDLNIVSDLKKLCEKSEVLYVPRINIGLDIGALKDVLQRSILSEISWDYICWFTDDMVPMRPGFIKEFVFQARDGASCYYISLDITPHIRTVGFCLTKEIGLKLRFQENIITKEDCWNFEFKGMKDNLYNQILNMGVIPRQVLDKEFSPVWDTNHDHHLNRWNEHMRNFNIEDLSDLPRPNSIEKFRNYKEIHKQKPKRNTIFFK